MDKNIHLLLKVNHGHSVSVSDETGISHSLLKVFTVILCHLVMRQEYHVCC